MRSLILFAKNPEPGRVKTRLHGALSPEQAATLAHAFLVDTVNTMRDVEVEDRRVAYAPAGAERAVRDIVGPGLEFEAQVDGDLGARMQAAIESAVTRGADRVVLIGADSPTLPAATLRAAFEALVDRDVVLGPSMDLGYYLIGVAAQCATTSLLTTLFEDVEWGTSQVLPETLERLVRAGVALGWLPPAYDVDSPAELAFLRAELLGRRLAGESCPAATAQWLDLNDSDGEREGPGGEP
jgi:rSAM/selenodomain-associated transferase 1